jgi:diguanylate cyclase
VFLEGPLRQILRVVPGQTPVQRRLLDRFEKAVTAHDWSAIQAVVVGYAKLGLSGAVVAEPDAHMPPASVLPDELAEQIARLKTH